MRKYDELIVEVVVSFFHQFLLSFEDGSSFPASGTGVAFVYYLYNIQITLNYGLLQVNMDKILSFHLLTGLNHC